MTTKSIYTSTVMISAQFLGERNVCIEQIAKIYFSLLLLLLLLPLLVLL